MSTKNMFVKITILISSKIKVLIFLDFSHFRFFFCRGSNPGRYIYYPLSLLIELNSRGLQSIQMIKLRLRLTILFKNLYNYCLIFFFISINKLDISRIRLKFLRGFLVDKFKVTSDTYQIFFFTIFLHLKLNILTSDKLIKNFYVNKKLKNQNNVNLDLKIKIEFFFLIFILQETSRFILIFQLKYLKL